MNDVVRLHGKNTIGDDLRALANRADSGELTGYAVAATLNEGVTERHVWCKGDYVSLLGVIFVLQAQLSARVIEYQTKVSTDGSPYP